MPKAASGWLAGKFSQHWRRLSVTCPQSPRGGYSASPRSSWTRSVSTWTLLAACCPASLPWWTPPPSARGFPRSPRRLRRWTWRPCWRRWPLAWAPSARSFSFRRSLPASLTPCASAGSCRAPARFARALMWSSCAGGTRGRRRPRTSPLRSSHPRAGRPTRRPRRGSSGSSTGSSRRRLASTWREPPGCSSRSCGAGARRSTFSGGRCWTWGLPTASSSRSLPRRAPRCPERPPLLRRPMCWPCVRGRTSAWCWCLRSPPWGSFTSGSSLRWRVRTEAAGRSLLSTSAVVP
mmetsp:Transcript_43818/g.137120  ORF Transcript_43818/g.137120 Transcript_43818/m.137120 type:complete len:292 (+) Transcript_43818:115-990(+)